MTSRFPDFEHCTGSWEGTARQAMPVKDTALMEGLHCTPADCFDTVNWHSGRAGVGNRNWPGQYEPCAAPLGSRECR